MRVEEILPLSWIRVAILMVFALLASMIFEPIFANFISIPPSFTLVVICVVASLNGPLFGVASGMIAGILFDLIGTGAIGVNMGSFAVIGFVVGKSARFLPEWNRILKIAAVSPLLLIHIPLTRLFTSIAGNAPVIGYRSAFTFLIANAACAVLLTPIVSSFAVRSGHN
ncbi:TPA: rod shape-determining protein MreD [bacterium]|nr:MAG: rod shape-determining protein MreD [Candidatus Hydrogenedentes bacterium CG1_02_42_14]PIU48682.1 MAG: rod shape-determining protein MreD [Candidatus Hydrogenedentes bacterium CG07_land_8_20_14_0_80_42_17]HBW47356.1 rod shape-determining protein MreD [bacterium]